MVKIAAIYGSPRRKGNTSTLLDAAVEGAVSRGAGIDRIVLRDQNISPCLEIYGCRKNGECAISDDFQEVRDRILSASGMIIATPVFFYTVSAHVKILMDRCQSLWVKKYWIEKRSFRESPPSRRGMVIAVGATRGKRLFDGLMLSMRYFFDVLDMEMSSSLLVRGLDFRGDVLKHPEHIDEARRKGADFAESLMAPEGGE